jgi:transposase
MARAYSRDLRGRAVAAVDAGRSPREIARLCRISERTLRRWRHLHATSGELAPRPHPGRPVTLTARHDQALIAHVAAVPDATLAERAAWLAETHGVQVHLMTVARHLHASARSFKKRV